MSKVNATVRRKNGDAAINRAETFFYTKIKQAVKEGSLFLEGEIKESISGNRAEKKSVDTGRFRGSVNSVDKDGFVATVVSNLSYARPLEYGTSKMSPRRHFRNSTNRNRIKIVSFVKKAVKRK